MSTDRIMVHSSVAPAFLAVLKSKLSFMYPPTARSTMVSSMSKARLQSLISSGTSAGAQVFHGNPESMKNNELGNDSHAGFAPTILGGVSEDMAVWQDESFGSITSYMTVHSQDEAVKIANRTGYGLSAAIFTKDLSRAFALAKRLESGYVSAARCCFPLCSTLHLFSYLYSPTHTFLLLFTSN